MFMLKIRNSPLKLRTSLSIIKRFYEVKYNMCVAPELPKLKERNGNFIGFNIGI